MEPKLSLDYSSGGGNGYLGIGWSIGGVSAITRCPQTRAVDGANHKFGVKYNSDDRFCLDGQRLINVKGSYGKDGTEYRTEINNYSKIVQKGMRADGPDSFKVQTKSGLTYYYGWYGENGKHKSYNLINGRKTFWKVSRISDTYGNHIDFQYKNNYELGYHYLYKIRYSNNTVTYIYENRPDVIRGYTGGKNIRIYKRLKEIVVKTGSTEVRRYQINYTNENRGSKRSKITSIIEHVKEGNLAKLSFSWISSNKRSFKNKSSAFLNHLGGGVNFRKQKGKDKGTRLADINGDGLVDIVQLYLYKGGAHRRVYLNTGSTFKYSQSFSDSLPDAYFSNNEGESMGTQLSDINGDGLIDLIQLYNPKGTVYYNGVNQQRIWINNGKKFVNKSSSYFANFGAGISFNKSKGRDKGTRLADINGDGLMDIVQLYLYKNGVHKRIYLNNGTSFRYNGSYSKDLPNAFFSNSDGEDMGTRLADINGDGLVDIIQLYDPEKKYYGGKDQQHLWINTGKKFVSANRKYLQNIRGKALMFSKSKGRDKGTRLVDINGDGLVDIIQLYVYNNGAHRRVYLNKGNTFSYSRGYSLSLPDAYLSDSDGENMGTQLVDMNGDGLPDIIQLYNASGTLYYGGRRQKRVYLNTGEGFEMTTSYALPTLSLYGGKGYSKGTHIIDIDGDGLSDIIQLYNNNGVVTKKLYLNTNKKALISHIYNRKDQNIYISYKNMTDKAANIYSVRTRNTEPWNNIKNDNIPVRFAMPLVYSVRSNNGVGGLNTIEYKYHDYIINKIRGAQGFRYIISYDTRNKLASGTLYRQIERKKGVGFHYTGLPYYTYQGRPYSGTGRNKNLGTWGKWLSKTELKYGNASKSKRIFEPYTSSNIQTIYDPVSKKKLKAVYHYNTISKNGLGNISKTVDKTHDYVYKKNFYKTTINEYRAENKDKWHIGRLTKSTVRHSQTDGYSVTRASTFRYNSRGVLKEEVSNAGTSLALKKYYKYDKHGNKVYESVSGAGVKTAKTYYEYSKDGKFQTRVINPAGLRTSKGYDRRFGTLTYLKNPNGVITRWKYDGLGRKIEETLANGIKTTWSYSWSNGKTIGGLSHVLYSIGISRTGSPFVRTYHDSFGREVGSYTYTMNKGSRTSLDSRRIVQQKYYNSKGELVKESLPHYQNRGAKFIHTYYDKYGRPTKVTKPGPNNNTQTYRMSYKNFTTIETDALERKKRTIKNAIDQTTRVTDAYGSSVSSNIYYKYDAAGNLKYTLDSYKNKIYMSYDVAGNKIYMSDPDLGKWHYEYNAAGQLKKQWSGSKGYSGSKNATYKSYDILGRVIRTNTYNANEKGKDASKYSYNYQTFTYGKANARRGSKGKLLQAYASSKTHKSDWQAETKTMSYDSLGRLIRTTTKVDKQDSYTTSRSYDAYSRLHTVTYPNGYKISYHYNSGMLDYIRGSDGKIHYNIKSKNAFGEVETARFANKVYTAIGYNSAGYAETIRSGRNGSYYTGNVQQVRYTYDGLGNVKTRYDDSIDGKYLRETFRYDAMNRLTRFSVSTNIKVEAFANSRKYTYNRIGNMTYKTGYGKYSYSKSKPHAVRSVGDRKYAYDAVGNMTSRNGDSIMYTPSNKPAILKNKNGKEVRFYYGVGGERFLKKTDEKRTIYLGKGYEIEQENGSNEVKSTIYMQVGGKTIGTHVEVVDNDYVKTNKKYKSTYNRYFHTDALGSITSITNDKGKVIERRSYEPFGKIRAMDYGLKSDNSIIPSNTVVETVRAFTGHEQIAELRGLIHMNARVYDSDIGRFLSADTVIQDPHDTQAYNRYSYVRNNPLKYTDPSGNSWWTKFRDKYIRTIAAIAVGAIIAIYAPGLLSSYLNIAINTFASAVATGALAGAAGGAIMTGTLEGTLKGAAFGALSAGMAYGIGEAFGHAGGIFGKGVSTARAVGKSLAHALSRGAISHWQGGTFRSGFASGFASSFFNPGTELGGEGAGGFTLRTTIAGVVGGTASEIGGGKFSNGAISGAFVHMFNAESGLITKSFESLGRGLYRVGDYLGRIIGFRDWQVNSIGLGKNYYRNQARVERAAVYELGSYAVENPNAAIKALSTYYNQNTAQMNANTLVNFYTGLAVPLIGTISLAGNIMGEAHEINQIYNSQRN